MPTTTMPKKTEKKLPGLRISKAADAAGVSRQTVEYYVMIGMIEPLRVDGSRQRFFDEALVKRIRLIHQLNLSGYTLRDIKDIYLKDR